MVSNTKKSFVFFTNFFANKSKKVKVYLLQRSYNNDYPETPDILYFRLYNTDIFSNKLIIGVFVDYLKISINPSDENSTRFFQKEIEM